MKRSDLKTLSSVSQSESLFATSNLNPIGKKPPGLSRFRGVEGTQTTIQAYMGIDNLIWRRIR